MASLKRTKDATLSIPVNDRMEDIDLEDSQVLAENSSSASRLRKRNPNQKHRQKPQVPLRENTRDKQAAVAKMWSWVFSQPDERFSVSKTSHQDGFWGWLSACHVVTPVLTCDAISDTASNNTMKHWPSNGKEDTDSTEPEKIAAKNLWRAEQTAKARDLTTFDWKALVVFSVVAVIVRLWRLSWPGEVIFDEAHYGRYVNEYLNRRFFLDSHPPLAYLMMTGIASYFGYDATFSFGAIGDTYPGSMPLIAMRSLVSIASALCTPLAYATMRASGHGALASFLAATFVTFDNALVATHRLFTPEGLFFLFTALTIFSWTLFLKHTSRPFSTTWWLWLLSTGIATGATVSTKITGLMTMAALGLAAAHDMWNLICNVRNTPAIIYRHICARAFALLTIPVTMYLAVWYIHFSIVTKQPDLGTDAGAYDFKLLSRELQNSLVAQKKVLQMYQEVAYGSVIRLQTDHTTGVALHSFYKSYERGSQQQQVFGSLSFNDAELAKDDPNTHWIVAVVKINPNDTTEVPYKTTYVKNGDIIRLRHVPTRQCLHSHNVRMITDPSNKHFREVSCYGSPDNNGDSNDWWVVQVIEDGSNKAVPARDRRKVHALSTRFRLRHKNQNCYLYTGNVLLPAINGANRWEVSCRSEAKITPRSIWRVTMNLNDYLTADAKIAEYPKPSFLQKLREVHHLMMSSTHYTSLPESPESPATSKPIKWPLLRNAIPAWRSYQRQVFIVGNPVVWGLCAIGLAAFWAIRSLITLRDQRGYTDGPTLAVLRSTHLKWSTYMAAGWAIHYMPFFFLKRGLFLYHYYPAFYCSILLTASMFSSLCTLFIRPIRVWLLAACMALTWVSFWYMSPLSYGSILRRESCTQMTSWHILRPEWGGGGSGHGGGFSSGINCDLTPTKDTLVQPISIAAQQARQDKLLWQERTEEYRIRSRALLDASQMPRSIAGQVRALFREPRLLPPGVGVGKDAAAGTSSHRLPQNYPPEDTVLPREDVFLAPYQRPPQWRSSPQNVYDGQTGQSQRNRYNPELNYVQHQKQRLDAEQAKAALERQAQGQKKVEVKKPIQTQPPKQQPRQPHVQQQQQRVQQQEKPKGQENQAQVKKQDGVHQRPAQEKPAVAPVEQGKERPRQPQQ